ncbi:MAG: hypothetical protein FJ087_14420 [Deltaproteobacteria bacterium]|nr:hypothetical protein [Deltaproteobacteria bacterium]
MGRTSETWNGACAIVARRRVLALIASAGITLLSLRFAPTVTTTDDLTANLPSGDPEVAFWLDMTRRFEGLSVLMVGLEEPGEPFTFDGLSRLARITDRLAERKADGVLSARSITNIESLEADGEGGVSADMLIPAIPREGAAMKALAERVRANAQVSGVLVSRDLSGYLVLVRADARKDARTVAALVRDVVEAERGGMAAHYFGAPFVSQTVTREAWAKLWIVVPLFAIGLLGVLLWRLRRPIVVVLVMVGAGVSLVWWLALVRIAGIDLTASTVNAVMVILVVSALGAARLAEARIRGEGRVFPRSALVSLAAVALGSAALAVVDRLEPNALPYLSGFGETTLLGVLAVALFGVFAVAPAASFLRVAPSRTDAPARPVGRAVLAVGLLVVLAAATLGATRLRFRVTLSELFTPNDEVGRALAFFDRRLGGSDLVQIHVDGDLRDPGVAARVQRLTDLLEGSGAFADVRSVSQILTHVAGSFAGLYRVPNDRESLANLWFFLEGQPDLRSLASEDRSEAMIVARVPAGNPDPDGMLAAARRAVELSGRADPEATAARVAAVAAAAGVPLPPGRAADVVAAAGRDSAEAAAARLATAREKVSAYLASPSSPFEPSPDDLARLAAAIGGDDAGRTGRLLAALSATPALVEGGRADIAAEAAGTLDRLCRDTDLEARAVGLGERLLAGSAAPSPAALGRVRGALADVVAGPPPGGERVKVTISGFPALAPRIAGNLTVGLWAASSAAIVAIALAMVVAARGRVRIAARVAAEAGFATLIAFGAAGLWFQTDSSSATLFLIAPIAACLSSGALEPDGRRPLFPATFALAIAVGSLGLLAIGVAPISRIGLAVAVSAAAAAVATWRPGTR